MRTDKNSPDGPKEQLPAVGLLEHIDVPAVSEENVTITTEDGKEVVRQVTVYTVTGHFRRLREAVAK